MTGTFLGIDIGASGLAASQAGQNVVGNNVANANTPGYSVESVDFQQNFPLSPPGSLTGSLPNGQVGTGVNVAGIIRSNSIYLDAQVRSANSAAGLSTTQNTTLQQVENAYGEPSSTGLNATLSSFYQSFNSVVSNPENIGTRAAAIQNGVAVANSFQSISSQLTQIGSQLTGQATSDLQTVNSYGTQIAALNTIIRASNATGQQPNTLLDQRGQLLDKLSALANISVQNNADGTVNVAVGTSDLVVGVTSNTLSLSGLQSRGDLQGGSLAGVVQSQGILQTNITNFNSLAATVAAQVNSVHSAGAGQDGSTGLSFFSVTAGSEASSIAVNPVLLSNPAKLAAAAVPPGGGVPPPGDGSNASQLAALQNQTLTSGPLSGSTSLGYYQQMITTVGSQAATAQTAASSAAASQTQSTQQRDSVTGVSTDQEMARMLQYQTAYQASARVVQTMATMLNTLITGLFP